MRPRSLIRGAVIPRRTAPDLGGPVACHAEAPVWHAAGHNPAGRRALVATGAALTAAVTLTACSGSSHGGGHTPDASSSTTGTGSTGPSPVSTIATRWWSNDATTDGSTIDPKDPEAAAEQLHPDRTQYCLMLSQTVKAGKSILPGANATDPRLLTSTEAFVSELQHVAPAQVSSQWKVLGDALVQFVKSGGKSLVSASSTDMSAAAQAIATDSKQNCHVDISGSDS